MTFPRSHPRAVWARGLRLPLLGMLVAAALLLIGCRSRPTSAPPPPATPPAAPRIAVVDLDAVARAHPRWRELNALRQKIGQVESQMAAAPPPPEVSRLDIRKVLDAEAKRLRAEFEKELRLQQDDGRRRLDTFAAALRAEQTAKFDAQSKQLGQEAKAAVEARRAELEQQLRVAELQIMEEYKFPLLNLRLRAEVAGLSSEQEAREVLRQIQALQQEREERIKSKGEELGKAFDEFQKAKETEINARLRATKDELTKTAQEQLAARQRDLQAELAGSAAEREKTFRARLADRQRKLISAAESQLRGRQGVFLNDLSTRSRQLRAELVALQEQRARLEDSILAEVKIEVATIAQEQRLDVVLTGQVSNITGIDITSDVVQRLKR